MEVPISPLQAMVNGMSAEWQKGRAKTQMTLGGLIADLEKLPQDARVTGLGDMASYRGYYSDLAIDPSGDRTVADLLAEAKSCMGKVFEGYKGGDFTMGENTPLFVAEWGDCGDRLMGLNTGASPIVPVTAKEE